MIVSLILPFPPSELSPNSTKHWRAKAPIKKSERELGRLLSLSHNGTFGIGRIKLDMIFYPPSNRHFDIDNCLAASKAVLDGVASGLGINDKQFRPITIDMGEPDKTNPRCELTITEQE